MLQVNTHQCGKCTACCRINGIVELHKPVMTKCQHQCKKGCKVYESRPESCRDYKCVWLRGFGSEKDSPNRIGIIVEERKDNNFYVKECRKGALKTDRALDYVSRIVNQTHRPAYVAGVGKREITEVIQWR